MVKAIDNIIITAALRGKYFQVGVCMLIHKIKCSLVTHGPVTTYGIKVCSNHLL